MNYIASKRAKLYKRKAALQERAYLLDIIIHHEIIAIVLIEELAIDNDMRVSLNG